MGPTFCPAKDFLHWLHYYGFRKPQTPSLYMKDSTFESLNFISE